MVYNRLRLLEYKDAPFMLEWMHDPTIARFFRFNAQSMTEEDCKAYIKESKEEANSKHYAIVDKKDEYLGTISLKNIDLIEREAEYAISTRKKVHGTGVALAATKEIFRIAFEELNLKKVYLNVLNENERANAFYKKVGFCFDYCEKNALEVDGELKDLNWYSFNSLDDSI